MKGKVKFYNNMKGFGFIISEDDEEYFVHYKGIKDKGEEYSAIQEEDTVTFDIDTSGRGPKAINVEVTNDKMVNKITIKNKELTICMDGEDLGTLKEVGDGYEFNANTMGYSSENLRSIADFMDTLEK